MSIVCRPLRRPALIATLAAALAACSSGETPQSPGLGSIEVSTRALTSDVVKVQAAFTGPLMVQIVYDLTPMGGGEWHLLAPNIPPGEVHAEVAAFDATGVVLYPGRGATTVVSGQLAYLLIYLQELSPPPSYGNNPPRIDSISLSTLAIFTGDTVWMTVTASDVDAGATLTYLWSASDGTLFNGTAPTAQWIAPATAGPQTIIITVRDEYGAEAEATFELTVQDPGQEVGGIGLEVVLNCAPVVSEITVAPSRVAAGESTTLTATASDLDGDAIAIQWSSSCAGTFSAANALTTTFTPAGVPDGTLCRVEAVATDGRGGSATGWSGVWIGPPPPVVVN